MEDEEIIALLWERKESGVVHLQEKYYGHCLKIAGRIVPNQEDAQECVNDVWLKVWKSIPPNRPVHLAGYLAKITRNLALDMYRRICAAKRGGGHLEESYDELAECISKKDEIGEKISDTYLKEMIQKFLEQKSSVKRSIFLQRYFYMLELTEIAENMQMKESSVRSVLSRLRKELKKTLEEEGIWI